VVGLSYRPTPQWNFEFDADYTDWSGFKTITVDQSGSGLLYGQDFHWTLNWEASWMFEFGATRYLGKHWQVSAGYVYSQNSMPDSNYQPVVADMNRHFIAVGAGYKSKLIDFDVAYQFGYGPERTVTGSEVMFPSGQTANGKYDFISHAVMVTAGVHF
jgi:long-chain fatty acid transport protein